MSLQVAVFEVPLLAGQGLAEWLATQPGVQAWIAADRADAHDADVLLVDLSRGEIEQQGLLAQAPRRPLPLVAIDSAAHPLPAAWRDWLGPDAVLRAPVAGDDLVQALHRVAGESTAPEPASTADDSDWLPAFPGEWDGIAVAAQPQPASAAPQDPLSPREREVARLIVQGLSNREVGERLFLATGTVRKHRENLMAKLAVRNLAGLTLWALAEGLVAPQHEPRAQPASPFPHPLEGENP